MTETLRDGSTPAVDEEEVAEAQPTPEAEVRSGLSFGSVQMVLGLAMLGSLDEASYFPSLMLSHTFTPLELSLGALCACLAIIVAVTVLHSACRPILDAFDKVLLHAVVAVFATIMTIDVAIDLHVHEN